MGMTQLSAAQTGLAASTTKLNEAEAASRLKNLELQKQLGELVKETKICNTNIGNFQSEICAIKKIRGELLMMKGGGIYKANIAVQDCEVSSWKEESCTVTCGGGTKLIAREILTPEKNGGAPCPPLNRTEICGTIDCPVNCQMGEWGGWSTCSAACGGGVRERQRSVEVAAQFGGEPCGETSDTEGCGVESCDKDCLLSPWSSWTACSKACDTGSQERSRSIDTPKKGDGKCWGKSSVERLDVKPCNAQPLSSQKIRPHCNALRRSTLFSSSTPAAVSSRQVGTRPKWRH